MSKKALLVTRVSGFVPQFEMNNVKILQEMGYEIHYAANFDVVVYGKDNSRLMGTGPTSYSVWTLAIFQGCADVLFGVEKTDA